MGGCAFVGMGSRFPSKEALLVTLPISRTKDRCFSASLLLHRRLFVVAVMQKPTGFLEAQTPSTVQSNDVFVFNPQMPSFMYLKPDKLQAEWSFCTSLLYF